MGNKPIPVESRLPVPDWNLVDETAWLRCTPPARLECFGHTDNPPTPEWCQKKGLKYLSLVLDTRRRVDRIQCLEPTIRSHGETKAPKFRISGPHDQCADRNPPDSSRHGQARTDGAGPGGSWATHSRHGGSTACPRHPDPVEPQSGQRSAAPKPYRGRRAVRGASSGTNDEDGGANCQDINA